MKQGKKIGATITTEQELALYYLLGELCENDKINLGLSAEMRSTLDIFYFELADKHRDNKEFQAWTLKMSESHFKNGFACWHCGHIEDGE